MSPTYYYEIFDNIISFPLFVFFPSIALHCSSIMSDYIHPILSDCSFYRWGRVTDAWTQPKVTGLNSYFLPIQRVHASISQFKIHISSSWSSHFKNVCQQCLPLFETILHACLITLLAHLLLIVLLEWHWSVINAH